jgi:hypothetical protein
MAGAAGASKSMSGLKSSSIVLVVARMVVLARLRWLDRSLGVSWDVSTYAGGVGRRGHSGAGVRL